MYSLYLGVHGGVPHAPYFVSSHRGKGGSQRIFDDLSVTIAQWLRARHIRNLVIRKVPGSIPSENTSPQIHMDLST